MAKLNPLQFNEKKMKRDFKIPDSFHSVWNLNFKKKNSLIPFQTIKWPKNGQTLLESATLLKLQMLNNSYEKLLDFGIFLLKKSAFFHYGYLKLGIFEMKFVRIDHCCSWCFRIGTEFF